MKKKLHYTKQIEGEKEENEEEYEQNKCWNEIYIVNG